MSYSGWWIYGEGEHFFKDESSLKEWSLEFLNEDEQQLIELYLAIHVKWSFFQWKAS